MRGKSLKWILLIFLLVFSLTIVNVTSAPPSDWVDVFVNPPEIRDDTLQTGSNFTVGINVFNVTDLLGWQVKMTWNASIINATTITEESFLKGPFPWDSHPYKDDTKPYAEQTRTPTTNATITPGWTPFGLTLPTLVETVNEIDKKYATSITPDAEEEWGNFGFGAMTYVAKLEVGVVMKWDFTGQNKTEERDKLQLQVSNDGGTTWGDNYTRFAPDSAPPIPMWIDVTEDFAWTPSMLTDANFKVRMRYKQVGVNATKISVNYLSVKAVDTLIVASPAGAYDKDTDSYASFCYSGTRGNFTVYDFSHDFPSDAADPIQEKSTIVQVDFNMKYWANASSLGDRYKIAYYVDPSSTPTSPETILEDWKSTETSLDTYTWANQSEPDDGVWDWTEVSNIRIVVETDRVGGDTDAVFKEYEAWVTVTHIRPTEPQVRLEEGWAGFSVTTIGYYPGLDGNGLLATVEFEVLAYGETILNITHADETVLWDSSTPPGTITFTPENGYFSNIMPGDVDGDGDVDRDDFLAFGLAYGSTPGAPNWNAECDFDRDGDVDRDDFLAFGLNYGRHI